VDRFPFASLKRCTKPSGKPPQRTDFQWRNGSGESLPESSGSNELCSMRNASDRGNAQCAGSASLPQVRLSLV
jgi:hypothetical protein